MAVDPVAEARSMIQAALNDLEAEARSLERALVGLSDPQRRASRAPTPPKRRRRGRAKQGQRRDELLAAVREQPGITVAQAAKKLGVKPPNALYALAKRLATGGEIVKKGAGYFPKGVDGATAKAKPRKTKTKKSAHAKPKRSGASRRTSGGKGATSPANKK